MRVFLMLFVLMIGGPVQAAESWLVDAPSAIASVGSALILDTRGSAAFALGHPEGAVRVTWEQFSRTEKHHRGELLAPAALEAELQKIGVRGDQKVVVVGDPDAWGEDGRIVWMLRAAGHKSAFAVDGGYPAWKSAGGATKMGGSAALKKGDFRVELVDELYATVGEVREALTRETLLIDTREKREFDGETPYGEQRGGHLPGAKHLHFKDLLGKGGKLKTPAEIQTLLNGRGIVKKTPIITYCTGGIRSGWMTMVLRSLGYNASNYAGSMWQWSSLPVEQFPLTTE